MTSAFLSVLVCSSVPSVVGDSTCPTATEVRNRLAALAEPGATDTLPAGSHRVYLSNLGRSIHVEMLAADGGLLAERTMDRTAVCSELAEAIAVVISTWEAKLDPNLSTPVVHPPARAPSEQGIQAARRTVPPSSGSSAFDAGIALLASVAGGEVVSGAKLAGGWRPKDSALGIDLMLSVTSTHAQPVATSNASADWMRAALAAGPSYRVGRAAFMLDLHLGAVLALLHVSGNGLWRDTSDTSLQFGGQGGLRGLWAWNNAAAWVGVDVFAYPGPDRLTVGNFGDAGQLPHWETQVAFGVSAGRFH